MFDGFNTTDFELVLKYLLHADKVNKILNNTINSTISESYENIKNNLINIIKEFHPEYSDVQKDLKNINSFLKKFKTVISLNYDLLIYWSVMIDYEKFVDYFKYKNDILTFNICNYGFSKKTEIFYLHGSLIFGKNILGNIQKLRADGYDNLLTKIDDAWTSQNLTPLFVSEGSSEKKLNYIQNNKYLNYIYNNTLA